MDKKKAHNISEHKLFTDRARNDEAVTCMYMRVWEHSTISFTRSHIYTIMITRYIHIYMNYNLKMYCFYSL